MSRFTKYKLYQKYETRGSQEAIPCYPNVFSIDGDGTMPLVIVEENSRDCGYTGETQPIYRWYTLPIDTYYYCDACQDAQYRWVNISPDDDWECVGTTKYYKQKKQVSVDGGSTWTDVSPAEYQRGAAFEYGSEDCGYRSRTTTGTPYCTGYDKYVDVYSQYSTDGGNTWQTTATTSTLVERDSSDCGYVPPTPTDYSNQYLTLVAKGSGTFKFSGNSVSYSLDSGTTWNTLASGTDSPTVQSGHKIMWKGNLTPSQSSPWGIGRFSASTQFDIEGNPMSLLFGDNFRGQTSLSGKSYAFYRLFSSSMAVSAENLALPATTLASSCYRYMFFDCTSLTTAPSTLPATSLADHCYASMFYGCSSLTSIPSVLPATRLVRYCYWQMFAACTSLSAVSSGLLPATTLTSGCYGSMFNTCKSLRTAPDLLATTLVDDCYANMFNSCTSLNYIKCLATDISANYCTSVWVGAVPSSGTFYAKSSTNWTTGMNGIPSGWTRVNI